MTLNNCGRGETLAGYYYSSKLYQQNMSYGIRTSKGKTIVIDGSSN